MSKQYKSLGRTITLLIIVVILNACGGGGGGTTPENPPPATTTVTGLVEVGETQVALFEGRSILTRLASMFISNLQAAITGLTPVVGATVELIRIDSAGDRVGAVLATATTDGTGAYSLETTEILSSDLVVQIDNGGNKIRAIALSTTTNINPVTEYVIRQILDAIKTVPEYNLKSITTETVNGLIDFVEALPDVDLSGATNIDDTIAAINAEAGAEIITKVTDGLYSVHLKGRTATSVVTSNLCNNVTGGWTYTFTDTGVTMVGTDIFNSILGADNCTVGAEETMIFTFAELQVIGDIPFNCGSNVCTNNDLNKVLEGTDGDVGAYTSIYTHILNSDTFTYIETVSSGRIITEIITLSPDTNIVGAWDFGQTSTTTPFLAVFYPNGFYIHYEEAGCAPGGVEYGTYTYDGITLSTTQILDDNGDCGLNNFAAITTTVVGGNTLTFLEGTTSFSGSRVDGGPGSLVGSWDTGGSSSTPRAIVFYADGLYMHWQDASSDLTCAPGGVEYGTYSYDGSTITGTAIVDNSGECGLHDTTNVDMNFTIPDISVDGDELTGIENGVSSTINRL